MEQNIKRYWLYSPGEHAKFWDDFYTSGIMGLGWDKLGDLRQFSDDSELKKALDKAYGFSGSKKNDIRANSDFLNRISKDDIIIVKKGRRELLGYGVVKSDYQYDNSRKDYQSYRDVNWIKKGNWKVGGNLAAKTLTDITDYSSEYQGYDKFYKRLLDIMKDDRFRDNKEAFNSWLIKEEYKKSTANQYVRSIEILSEIHSKDIFSEEDDSFLESLYDELINKQSLDDSVYLTSGYGRSYGKRGFFSASVKQFREFLKVTIDEAKKLEDRKHQSPENIIFFGPPGTGKTYTLKTEYFPKYTTKSEAVTKEQNTSSSNAKRYEFVTFHQSYAYEDFIEGIKPVMESEVDGELRYEIKDGLFKTLCKRAKNDRDNRYAIFIDEINRGNVSSIFGELITLIEPDKRLGMDHAMTITLPYSREEFGVPSNVDIFGTMNTADRSVEALDTALRRRFAFKEMLPDTKELNNDIDGFVMKDLLICINERIEALIDRDHTIGHSYLINVKNMNDLKLAFKDKIIPLLQEYFYGDYGKIGLVLGSGFVRLQPRENEVFADFEYDGSEGLAQNKFELIRIDEMDEDHGFKLALTTLLNRK